MKLFTALVVLCMTAAAFSIPQQINYQGYLTRPNGTPLDTTVAMTFRLYTDSTAGTLLWTEARPSVAVNSGLFHVRLGQMTSLGSAVFNNTQVWLGVTVGGNSEMTPRSRIVSAGYAYRTGTVDGASGGTIVSDLGIQGRVNAGSGNSNTGAYSSVFGQNNIANEDFAFVGGGVSNNCGGSWGVIAGGLENHVNVEYGTVGGGRYNQTNALAATVSGGSTNNAGGTNSAIGGGTSNQATGGNSTVAGGSSNLVSAAYATIGGGFNSTVTEDYATVGGGYRHEARGYAATVAGGYDNTADSAYAAVGGGYRNIANANYGTVGGGLQNSADSSYTTVAGGMFCNAIGYYSSISGGQSNDALGHGAAIGGGRFNVADGQFAVIAGGGGYSAEWGNTTAGSWNSIGGGRNNSASSSFSVVCGGDRNEASGTGAAVGGGTDNRASNYGATVCGGDSNRAAGYTSFVGGGRNNSVRGDYSVIAGGGGYWPVDSNYVSGNYSMIPGGTRNWVEGDYSFAAGRRARTIDDGCFVWADATDANLETWRNNQFLVRAAGGAVFFSNAAMTTGVELLPGAGAWANACDSTLKTGIRAADTRTILDKLQSLPIKEWRYKSEDPAFTHIGPMAQDFHAVFGYGDSDTKISTLDPDGVALAAIQELAKQMSALRDENIALRARVQTLEANQQETIKKE